MAQVVVTDLEYRKAQKVFQAAAQQGLNCQAGPPGEQELTESSAKEHPLRHRRRRAIPRADVRRPARGGVLARFGGPRRRGQEPRDAARHPVPPTRRVPGRLRGRTCHQLCWPPPAGRPVGGRLKRGSGPDGGTRVAGKKAGHFAAGDRPAVAQIASFGFRRTSWQRAGRPDIEASSAKCGFKQSPRISPRRRPTPISSAAYPQRHATRYYMNRERFGRMPAKAWLINTARGAIVDEKALYEAIVAGMIGGAALDVFEREPYVPVDPDKDLRALKNVIMTPHVGSSTQEACDRMALQALDNIALAEAGKYGQMNLLNPQVIEAK